MFEKKKQKGNLIKERRDQLLISQQKLAEKVNNISIEKYGTKRNIHWKTIRSIENDKYVPSLKLGMLIAEALDTHVEKIFIMD
ncbi:hypothetical protein IGJ55_002132 [Enterococcus sp. AZ170]|uniref:helix-turn-helix transcriptional regulator n=1 Tax=unclassified Enterococcus TaxID=2608891 RepID=UPI003D2CBE16